MLHVGHFVIVFVTIRVFRRCSEELSVDSSGAEQRDTRQESCRLAGVISTYLPRMFRPPPARSLAMQKAPPRLGVSGLRVLTGLASSWGRGWGGEWFGPQPQSASALIKSFVFLQATCCFTREATLHMESPLTLHTYSYIFWIIYISPHKIYTDIFPRLLISVHNQCYALR